MALLVLLVGSGVLTFSNNGQAFFLQFSPTFPPKDGEPTPLANADIRCLVSLMHGQSEYLWVGTNAGLYGGPPNDLQKLPSLAGRAISALLWDSRHHIVWIGTDKGLCSLIKRTTNEWIIAEELTGNNSGLAVDRVTSLALSGDKYGKRQLWIGTPCGLSCYSY